MDKITQELIKVKTEASSVAPQNREQIEKLNKIHDEIAKIDKMLEFADEAMDRNDQEKDKLTTKHEENQVLVSSYAPCKLVEMVHQTKGMAELIKNYKDWESLYKRLKQLQADSIVVGDFDLQKTMQDAKKYVENIANGRKDEYDDIIKKIKKVAKKIRDDCEEQGVRLDDFENKNLKSDLAQFIPDADFLYLNKEIGRYRSSIDVLRGQQDTTLDESTKVDTNMKNGANKGLGITPEDLHVLKSNLKSLEKHLLIDVPRIKKNIDQLEAYALKSLKNRLQEDNKKSQAEIS